MSLGSTLPLKETSTKNIFWGGKGSRCILITTFMLRFSCKLAASTSQNPLGLKRDCFTFTSINSVTFQSGRYEQIPFPPSPIHAICSFHPTFNPMGAVGSVTEKSNLNGKLKILRCYKTTQHTLWQAMFSKTSLETWSIAQGSSSFLWQNAGLTNHLKIQYLF
jgi:hypothetical protein